MSSIITESDDTSFATSDIETVGLYVCLSVRTHISKNHMSKPRFHVAVARSSYVVNVFYMFVCS